MIFNIEAYNKETKKINKIKGFCSDTQKVFFEENNKEYEQDANNMIFLRKSGLFDNKHKEFKENDIVICSIPNINSAIIEKIEGIIKFNNGEFKVNTKQGEFSIISLTDYEIIGNTLTENYIQKIQRYAKNDEQKFKTGNYFIVDICKMSETYGKEIKNPRFCWNYTAGGDNYKFIKKEHRNLYEAWKNKETILKNTNEGFIEVKNFLNTYNPLNNYQLIQK